MPPKLTTKQSRALNFITRREDATTAQVAVAIETNLAGAARVCGVLFDLKLIDIRVRADSELPSRHITVWRPRA